MDIILVYRFHLGWVKPEKLQNKKLIWINQCTMRNLLIRCTKKFKLTTIFDFIFTYVGESIKKWPYGLGRSSCRAGHLSLHLIKPPLTPPKERNCFGKTGSLSY